METLHIRRAHARYRLPAYAAPERQRFDHVFHIAAREMLGAAISNAGLPPNEIVCLRTVRLRTRLDLTRTSDTLAAQWSQEIAEAIRRAAESPHSGNPPPMGKSENAVRYRSLAAALEDHVCRVSHGEYELAWAWRQLGFWPDICAAGDGQAVQWTLDALARHPSMIVPILTSAVRRGWFPEWAARLDVADWIDLSRAAWMASSGSPDGHPANQWPPTGMAYGAAEVAESRAQRILDRSLLIPEIPRARLQSGGLAQALAALAMLECEPALIVQSAFARRIGAALVRKMEQASSTGAVQNSGTANATPDPRAEARSRYGGLLLLINPIADLELWNELAGPDGARTTAWSLHQLAAFLCDAAPDDAARLAFSGLGPGDPPPDLSEPPATEAEQSTFAAIRERIVAELKSRLPDIPLHGGALLEWVCRGSCVIKADPGWIEARFPLESVSTAIRRARLDLNPGYQPWLGVTVMFVYE